MASTQPVRDRLAADPTTGPFLARITEIVEASGPPPDVATCADAVGTVEPSGDLDAYDGVWHYDVTPQDGVEAGLTEAEAEAALGRQTVRLDGGTFEWDRHSPRGEPTCDGTYVVDDGTMSFSAEPGCGGAWTARPVRDGNVITWTDVRTRAGGSREDRLVRDLIYAVPWRKIDQIERAQPLPEGIYRWEVTEKQLLDAGVDSGEAYFNGGLSTFTVRAGHWLHHVDGRAGPPDCGGPYEIRGSRIAFLADDPPACEVIDLVFSGRWEAIDGGIQFTAIQPADTFNTVFWGGRGGGSADRADGEGGDDRRPPAWWAEHLEAPTQRFHPVHQGPQPGARPRVGVAGTVVGDGQYHRAAVPGQNDVDAGGSGVLDGVGQRLGADEPHRLRDLGRRQRTAHPHAGGDRTACRQVAQRRLDAPAPDRLQPRGEPAQVVPGAVEFRSDASDAIPRGHRLRPGEPVASSSSFCSAPSASRSARRPRSASAATTSRRREPSRSATRASTSARRLSVDEPGGGGDGVEQRGIGEDRRVVHQHGHRSAQVPHHGRGPRRACPRQGQPAAGHRRNRRRPGIRPPAWDRRAPGPARRARPHRSPPSCTTRSVTGACRHVPRSTPTVVAIATAMSAPL